MKWIYWKVKNVSRSPPGSVLWTLCFCFSSFCMLLFTCFRWRVLFIMTLTLLLLWLIINIIINLIILIIIINKLVYFSLHVSSSLSVAPALGGRSDVEPPVKWPSKMIHKGARQCPGGGINPDGSAANEQWSFCLWGRQKNQCNKTIIPSKLRTSTGGSFDEMSLIFRSRLILCNSARVHEAAVFSCLLIYRPISVQHGGGLDWGQTGGTWGSWGR